VRAIHQALLIGFSVLAISASAQVSSTAPTKSYAESYLNPDIFSRLALRYGRKDISKEIQQELLDTNTICFIARVNGLTATDLATIEIAPGFGTNGVTLYQVHKPDTVFKILSEQLGEYVNNRQQGHSKTFLFTALSNHLEVAKITDPELRVIMTNQPWLAVSWLKMTGSKTFTNGNAVISTAKPGEKVRLDHYTVVDGDIGWEYAFYFHSDGGIFSFHSERFDAKELDPKYAQIIKSVEADVEAEMKEKGQNDKFGSVHIFWELEKKKLKAKGIDWRSPAELNPNSTYD
jgi:hypothetical protein